MNKQKMINGLEDIRVTLLHYFNKNNSMYLDILDGDSRQYLEKYKGYSRKGYSGVTVKYLREYLFDKKYSISMISYVLLDLLSKADVRTLPCGNIDDIVFENTKSCHWSHYFINKGSNETSGSINDNDIRYKPMIKSYNAINSYLNK